MILLAFAAAALAQPAPATAHPANHATPAPAVSAARFSVASTTIKDILASPAATAVVEKHLPGFSRQAAMMPHVGHMSLKAAQPIAPAHLTDALLAAIEKDLAALPPA